MINKRFFNFKKYDIFLLNKANIPDDAIVFIQDKLSIYTHGTEYVCGGLNSSVLSQNSLEFKDSAGNVAFSLSIDNGTITLTDSTGNTVTEQYVLKSLFDEYLSANQPLILQIDLISSKVNTIQLNQTTDVASLRRWVNSKFDDMVGIDAAAVSELKAILNDDDTTTGILNEISKKADKTLLFSGSYDDLTDKPNIPIVPTNVSAFTNDAGYLTEHQDISGKANVIDVLTSLDQIRQQLQHGQNLVDLTVLANAMSTALDIILDVIDDKYVLKKDVYDREYTDWSVSDVYKIDVSKWIVYKKTLYPTNEVNSPSNGTLMLDGSRFSVSNLLLDTDE